MATAATDQPQQHPEKRHFGIVDKPEKAELAKQIGQLMGSPLGLKPNEQLAFLPAGSGINPQERSMLAHFAIFKNGKEVTGLNVTEEPGGRLSLIKDGKQDLVKIEAKKQLPEGAGGQINAKGDLVDRQGNNIGLTIGPGGHLQRTEGYKGDPRWQLSADHMKLLIDGKPVVGADGQALRYAGGALRDSDGKIVGREGKPLGEVQPPNAADVPQPNPTPAEKPDTVTSNGIIKDSHGKEIALVGKDSRIYKMGEDNKYHPLSNEESQALFPNGLTGPKGEKLAVNKDGQVVQGAGNQPAEQPQGQPPEQPQGQPPEQPSERPSRAGHEAGHERHHHERHHGHHPRHGHHSRHGHSRHHGHHHVMHHLRHGHQHHIQHHEQMEQPMEMRDPNVGEW